MVLSDVRYALRGLWHARGFSTVAILCLSLGIGLNTTIFSILDGILLKPFPYADPERIVALNAVNQPLGIGRAGLSYQDLQDLERRIKAKEKEHAQLQALQDVGAVVNSSLDLNEVHPKGGGSG